MSDPQLPPRREFIYRTIQLLMLGDILLGAVLAVLGLVVFESPPLAIAGAVLAAMGLGLTVVFRVLAQRTPSAADVPRPMKPRQSPHQRRR
jgi:hypothetical protein